MHGKKYEIIGIAGDRQILDDKIAESGVKLDREDICVDLALRTTHCYLERKWFHKIDDRVRKTAMWLGWHGWMDRWV